MKLLLLFTILLSMPSFAERICFTGDTGTGKIDQYIMADAMFRAGCFNIVIAGDLIYDKGLKDENDLQFHQKFLIPYAKLMNYAKFYLVLGNHDYSGDQKAWFKISEKYPNIIIPHYYHSAYIDGVCLTMFDSYYKGIKQTNWLREQAKAECKVKVAVNHWPYKSSGWHKNANFPHNIFMKMWVMGKFDYLITGHDHQLSDEGDYKGTRMLISGAGAKVRSLLRKPGVWGSSKLGFIIMDTETLEVKFVDKDLRELHKVN